MTTFNQQATDPWNGVERRLNGNAPGRAAIMCQGLRAFRPAPAEQSRPPEAGYCDTAPPRSNH